MQREKKIRGELVEKLMGWHYKERSSPRGSGAVKEYSTAFENPPSSFALYVPPAAAAYCTSFPRSGSVKGSVARTSVPKMISVGTSPTESLTKPYRKGDTAPEPMVPV